MDAMVKERAEAALRAAEAVDGLEGALSECTLKLVRAEVHACVRGALAAALRECREGREAAVSGRGAKTAWRKRPAVKRAGPVGRARPGDAETEAGGGDKPPERKMGVCVICGSSYLRRSNVQKCCSEACLEKKRAGLDKDGNPV